MTKKAYGDGLDASFIISQTKSRQRELQPYSETSPNTDAEVLPPNNKEEPRRRRSKNQDYESLFIHNSVSDTRNSNTAYIRRDLHKRLMRIVQVVSDNKVHMVDGSLSITSSQNGTVAIVTIPGREANK